MPDVHVVPSRRPVGRARSTETRGPPTTRRTRRSSTGSQLAEEQASELVVHGEDGKIREKDCHGNDPRDIPG